MQNRLAEVLAQRGIGQRQLARAVQMSPDTISELCRRPDRIPSLVTARRLAATLGVRVEELFPDEVAV